MSIRTINAPGVEIKEIDKSGYSPAMVGTACYLMGFTPKGEPYRPMEFTSRAAFENYYGTPHSEDQRYMYAAACEALNQGGRLYTARLPYDNLAFEKMVGKKYTLKTMSDYAELTAETGKFRSVYDLDNQIADACLIESSGSPILYDLSSIDEFRTDEARVPANTFLIVDTTGGSYSRITEDDRKGQKRELVGIVPIVTTAANALYAQQYIHSLEVNRVSAYEPIAGGSLKTLTGVKDEKGNPLTTEGLLSSDMAAYFNTFGLYREQKYSFELQTIRTEATSELADKIGDLLDQVKGYAEKYKLGIKYNLDFSTIKGLIDFVEKVGKYDVNNDTDTLATMKQYAQTIIDEAKTNTYRPITDDGEANTSATAYTSAQVSAGFEKFNEFNPYVRFADGDYINPASWKIEKDANGNDYYSAQLMVSSKLDVSEWHGINGDDSIPTTMCLDAGQYFSTIQPAADGVGLDPEHLKDIGVVVYKLYVDSSEGNMINWEAVEAYCGSLYKDDKDPNTGVTKFIDTIINSQSNYINFFSNCFSTVASKKFYKENCDILIASPTTGCSMGMYQTMTDENISIDKSILDGMNKCFDKVSDINERDIDIVPDAGISNIASYLKAIFGNKGKYDLTITDDIGNSLLGLWTCKKSTDASVKMWKTIVYKLDNFCKNIRKDCMFITECPRPLVLQGQKKIIRDSKPANTIDANILPYLPSICGLNTSYGAGYMDWFEQADDYTGDFFWCPPSIKAMGAYVNTDVNYDYWDAPAGLTRGVIAATDVSFSPTIKQAGAIYEKCWNYAINYPNDGIILEGQKTLQTKPTALDRVNVRRLMLRLERQAHKVLRWFVYEPHTAYTRQRVIDALNPYFKECKLGGGCYDYIIKCDEDNNTSDVIDRNELVVQIGIKPVKTIEFILCSFTIGSTGSTWSELGLD